MEKKQVFLKKVWILILIASFLTTCKKENEAVLKINISGLEGQSAIFQEQRVNGVKILDTVAFNSNSSLTYKVSLRQPTFYNLNIPTGPDIFFLISPGDKVIVTGSANDRISKIKIKGSVESKKLNILYDSLFSTREILKNIRKAHQITKNTEIHDSLNNEYEQILDIHRKFSYQFVLDNLQSLCSIAALYQEVGPSEFVFGRKRDMQFFKLATDTLSKYYPRHRHVQALKRNFDTMLETIKLEKILDKVGSVKNTLPNLELPSPEGTLKSLGEIKQRYVLLNFYNEAVQENSTIFPQLNKIYKKYYNKNFNIYNVYLGKSTENWEKIIHYEEIKDWINVADTTHPFSKTRAYYNVQALPSNYLIDLKQNTILLRDISPAKLNQILSNLVNNN